MFMRKGWEIYPGNVRLLEVVVGAHEYEHVRRFASLMLAERRQKQSGIGGNYYFGTPEKWHH